MEQIDIKALLIIIASLFLFGVVPIWGIYSILEDTIQSRKEDVNNDA